MKSIVYFVLIKLTYLNMTALNCSTTKGSLPSLILHISYGYNPKRNCRSFCSKNCNSLWSWELKVCGFNLRFYTTLGTHFLVLVHISVRFILSICGLGQINQQGKKKSFAYTWGTREFVLLLISSTTSFTCKSWLKGSEKRPTSTRNVVLYLFSYFIPELAVCHCIWAERQNIEKKCWYESGNFQSPQYFAISASLFSGPSHQVLSNLYFPISSNKVIERNIKDPTTMYDTKYEILHWETWPNLNHMLGIQKSSLYLIWKSWFLELKVR